MNATSEALQASETDLAAAATTAIASLRSNVAAMRNTANEFERLYNAADIDTRVSQSQPSKRIRTVPSNLTNFVTDRFLTNSADAVSTANVAERTKQQLKLDFFIPVLDAVLLSLDSRFNSDCVTVLESISSVITFDENRDSAIGKLCAIANIDCDLCVADAKHLLHSELFSGGGCRIELHEFAFFGIEADRTKTPRCIQAFL